jgi:ankyrin repeat protein
MRNPRAGGTIYIWTLGTNMTPHTVAHLAGHREVFDLLMAESPPELQFAVLCELGREEGARRMLAADSGLLPRLTARDHQRLVAAAVDNRLEPVRLMLELGWPVGVRGQEGGTALHWAALHGNADMVRLLLARGPDLTLRDTSHDGTPLDWAMYGREHGWSPGSGDFDTTIRLLREPGADR